MRKKSVKRKSKKNSIYKLLVIGLIILIFLFIFLILLDIFGKKADEKLKGELGSLSPIGQEPIGEALLKEATTHSGVMMDGENEGYIIELKSEPFFENRAGGIAYRQKIREEHIILKQQIEQNLGKSIGGDIKLFDEFEDAFNGIALDISKTECEFLKNRISIIKECYPNLKVHTLLDKSVNVINANLAYSEFGLTGENITIAVIDTGIDPNHESLDDLDDNPDTNDPKIIGFKDFVNFRTIPYDDHMHGTHVSGIAAGTGGSAGVYKGVAPRAKLVGVKVLNSGGSGSFSDVIAGIEWTIQNKDKYNISIISMSLGANLNSDGATPVEIAATTAVENGISFVVAAGNAGPGSNSVGIPASAKKVITVGAIDDNKNIAGFSSRGPTKDGRIKPEVSAPGVNIMAPDANTKNKYASHSGTSMATPHVAGVVALLKQANSSLSSDEIRQLLMDSALDRGEKGADNAYGWGVVDTLQALLKIYPQEHELSVDDIQSKNIYDTNTPIKITALIKNKGANNESNIKVRFLVNGVEQSNRVIDSIYSGSEASLDFVYVSGQEGQVEATVLIEPVNGENIVFDNNYAKEITVKDYIGKVKAVVLDSWGTYSSGYSIFPDLNDYWYDFGDYKIEIDYESFNGKETTYELLKQTNADVLIISDAWQDGNYLQGWGIDGTNWEFSDSEIEAIKKYVEEGHGLIITSGTLSVNSPGNVGNNMKLAPLVGLDENSNGFWAEQMLDSNFNIYYLNHELFNNMTKYVYGERNTNIGLNLSSSDAGDILARSYDDLSIITGHHYGLGNTIYFANMVEYGTNIDDKQIFYNSILWANKNYEQKSHDLKLYNLSLDGVIKYGEVKNISTKLANKGNVPESNINVRLLINNFEEQNITIPSLNAGEETDVNFEFTLNKTGIQSVIIKTEAMGEESKEYDNSIGKNVFVSKASLTGVARDYGVDENSNGLYDYLAVDIELNVIESDEFRLGGLLTSQLGVEFENPDVYSILSPGLHNITLKFNGLELRRMGIDGPYKLKDLGLSDEKGSVLIDSLYNTASYSYDDFESYPDLSVSDIIRDNEKIVVNQSTKTEVAIQNIGTEDAFNINVSLYQHDFKDYSNLILINSSVINNISVFEEKSVIFDITPEQVGYLNYLVNISDAEDGNLENNNYEFGLDVLGYSPDLTGNFEWVNKAIVNKELILNAIIENRGIEEAKNTIVDFYEEKEYGNLVLLESKNITSLMPDETKELSLSLTPKKLGRLIIVGNITADDEINQNNNRFSNYITIVQDGADVIGDFYPNTYPFIINKEGKINIWLENVGTKKADNVKATLYEDDDGILKEISSINPGTLESDGQYNKEVSWIPSKAGNNNLILKITADNDMNLENNEVKENMDVRLESPDIFGYFNYDINKLILNKENNISVYVNNNGVIEAQNVVVSLYENACDDFGTCNYVLIDSKNFGNIEANDRKNINFSYVPAELGWQGFKINVSADNELEEYKSNNDYTFSLGIFAQVDLGIDVNYYRYAFLNKEMNISSYIRNNGINEALNAAVSLYKYTCDEFGDCSYVLVDSKNIGNIKSDEYKQVNFSYTPTALGYSNFKINVSAGNEENYKDNERGFGFEVVNNGPDITAELKTWELGNVVVNNEVLIPAEISNIGNQDANNIQLTLYNVSYDDGKQLTQIEQKTIASLSASEKTTVMFSYTPANSGWIDLELTSSLADDVYSGNNNGYGNLYVLNSVTDVSGLFLFYSSYAIKNKVNYLDIEVRDNDIIGAKNVLAELYDNGNLVKSLFIPKINASDAVFFKNIEWTPTSLGAHNLTLIVTADDDIKLDNNAYSEFINAYDSMQTTFNVKNSSGSNLPRYLTVNEDRFFVDKSYTRNITQLSKFDIGIDNIYYNQNSGKEVFAVFLDSELNNEMNAVSEYHENISDGNLFFDIVYANNPNWSYNNFSYYMSYYGLQTPKDVYAYGCSDWNFSSLKCKTDWVQNNDSVKYIGEEGVYIAGDFNGRINALGFRNIVEPGCGNGICGVGEDCSNCSADCGVCPSIPRDSGGSGGGGSGGGGGGSSTTKLFTSKNSNEPLKINTDNDNLDIEFLGLRFVNEQEGGFIQFKKLDSLGDIPTPTNNNYAYFSITHPNIENQNIKDGNIIFKVNKKWLEDNNLSREDIILLRYNDSWKELPTYYQESDNVYNYYRSDINALSIFAISAKESRGIKESWFKIKPYVYVIIIAMIALLLLIILIMKVAPKFNGLGKVKEIEIEENQDE